MMVRFGCCVGGASFVPQANEVITADPVEALGNGLALVAEAGYDFAELTVGALTGLNEADFARLVAIIDKSSLKVPVLNSFVPPHLKLTGPEVDQDKIAAHVDLAMSRARTIGCSMIIFGSGGARSYPAGFPEDEAMRQIVRFLAFCNGKAVEYGMLVLIEPLNRKESNLIHTVKEALFLCQSLQLSHIRVLADSYHMLEENEPLEILEQAVKSSLLAHVHIADRDRVFPGLPAREGMDFSAFFRTLEQAGYTELISAECRADDVLNTTKASLNYVRSLWRDIQGKE